MQSLIQHISALTATLPHSIDLAQPTDKIYTVISSVESEEGNWPTFNRRFDLLFAADCMDKDGRMRYLKRGQYGMDAVNTYLRSLSLDGLPLDLVEIKLTRLRDALIKERYVDYQIFYH